MTVDFLREERPEYRLLSRGRLALSINELLCIITGDNGEKCERLMEHYHNNLHELLRVSISDMKKASGMTTRQCSRIVAAYELMNRKMLQSQMQRDKISGSRDVYEAMGSLKDEQYEQFWVIIMNRANRIVKKVQISDGGVSGTVADPKKIFRMAMEYNASSIILCHNHPSGNIQPSEADIKLTKKMKESGILLDLPVLDHLIIGNDSYYSFADEGMM